MATLPKLIPFPGARASDEELAVEPAVDRLSDTARGRQESLEATLAQVRQRWGYGSIVRLDRESALSRAATPTHRPKPARELPPWWPRQLGPNGVGGVLRPRLLEVVAEPGSGRLTLSLAWL